MLIMKAKAMAKANGDDTGVIVVPAIGDSRAENVQRRRPTKGTGCRNGQEPARTIIAIGNLIATFGAVKIDLEKIDKKLPRRSRRRSR